MVRFLLVLAAAALAAGCGKSGKEAKTEQAASEAPASEAAVDVAISGQRKLVDLNAGNPQLSPEQKVGGVEGRSPFEGDRVIKLNAIVRRSLDLSREFDGAAPGIRAAIDAAAAGGDRAAAELALKTMDEFHGRAMAAREDMTKAEQELKASGEYYNEVIFAGMQKFVAELETELREEKEALAAKLG